MIDLSKTTQGKLDQINADLVTEPFVIKISHLTENFKDGKLDIQQPISVHWYGGENKPFKPCLSMRRVLSDVSTWGKDGIQYKDRYLKLFNDKKVKMSGEFTGGVRISHMSNLENSTTIMLKKSRGKKEPYTVHPISALDILKCDGEIAAKKGTADFVTWGKGLTPEQKASLGDYLKELTLIAKNADKKEGDKN